MQTNGSPSQVVLFTLDTQRFAVALHCVARVVPAVELTVVPGAPPVLVGVFSLQGEVIPVLDRRWRSAESVQLTDQLLVLRTPRRLLALLVDEVLGVVEASPVAFAPDPAATAGLERYQGTTQIGDDLVLVHDVEAFLSPQEARAIDLLLEPAA